jgi:hypothetical protein
MNLEITEIATPVLPQKRKVSEAQKKAQMKWRATHADKYREKCRQHSQAYYERHHDEILERAQKRHLKAKSVNKVLSGSEMSE